MSLFMIQLSAALHYLIQIMDIIHSRFHLRILIFSIKVVDICILNATSQRPLNEIENTAAKARESLAGCGLGNCSFWRGYFGDKHVLCDARGRPQDFAIRRQVVMHVLIGGLVNERSPTVDTAACGNIDLNAKPSVFLPVIMRLS